VQLVLLFFAALMGTLTGVEVHRQGLAGLALSAPALLATLLFLIAYGVVCQRQHGLGWRALYRTRPEHKDRELMAVVGSVVFCAPWALTGVKTIDVWTGTNHHSLPAALSMQAGWVLFPLLFWLVLYLDARGSGGWWGGGGGPDEPEPPEPSWWPDFDRQFRRYASALRQPVGV
jgi:hypothetical protein